MLDLRRPDPGEGGEEVELTYGPEAEGAWRERTNAEVREALDQLRGLDEAGRICWMLGITRDELKELGGLGPER